MSKQTLYPCQLAAIEKRSINNEPLSNPIYTGLPDYARSENTARVTLHCPITDRYVRCIYYRQELMADFVAEVNICRLCESCEYKKRIEEGIVWNR